MRVMSAAMLKGQRKTYTPDGLPQEGSRIRAVRDLFYPPLKTVRIDAILAITGRSNAGKIIDDLNTYYGMDIRVYSKRTKENNRKTTYWLVGEYKDGEYVDYIESSDFVKVKT